MLPDFQEEACDLNKTIDVLVKDIGATFSTKILLPNDLGVDIIAFGHPCEVPGVRGAYVIEARKIVLCDYQWCRKTLIHELMHAASSFSNISQLSELNNKKYEIIEGLTELLTGYVLFTKYKDCYENWLESRYPICSMSYRRYVKLFGTITQVLIPIRDLIRIYVYNPNANWFEEYYNFLNCYNLDLLLIKRCNTKNFYELIEKSALNIIRRNLGREGEKNFKELLYEAPLSEVLNYSTMLK